MTREQVPTLLMANTGRGARMEKNELLVNVNMVRGHCHVTEHAAEAIPHDERASRDLDNVNRVFRISVNTTQVAFPHAERQLSAKAAIWKVYETPSLSAHPPPPSLYFPTT